MHKGSEIGSEGMQIMASWTSEQARRSHAIHDIQEQWGNVLGPVLDISTRHVVGIEEAEDYYSDMRKAIQQVAPEIVLGCSGQFKLRDLCRFFEEVCSVPSTIAGEALVDLVHEGVLESDEHHFLHTSVPTAA
jgi:hypothetical protein